MNAPWIVHKFGGTSVANAERYQNVALLLDREPGERKAVVVSAMSKVTDALIALTALARARDDTWRARLDAVVERHLEAARALLQGEPLAETTTAVLSDARDLAEVLRAVWLGRNCPESTLELVAGYGELWSARILGAYLHASDPTVRWLDAREVLIVREGELGPVIDWEVSRAKLKAWLGESPPRRVVITGYIASTPDGVPTTLKRNGSDFSASIFGALLDASAVVIWTDVDGVLSADPRRVPEARVLDEMSYDEAMELAYFGAKVVHPRTMTPAVERAIPIWIRNTFNPAHPGTCIHAPKPRGETTSARAVQGFSTFDQVALVNVEGTGMVGVPGVAQRIFGALRAVHVSVVLISQASSEHSVCLAVPEAQGPIARETVERAFASEVSAGEIQRVELIPGCSILAAVGDRMADSPGVAARFFGALARAGVNVRAIAQGSSERNLSAVIDGKDSTRALRAVHAGFYLSRQVLSLGVVGPGLVGSTLLQQLATQAPVLRERAGIDLRVRAIVNSSRMLLDDTGIDLATWRERFARESVPADFDGFVAHLGAPHLPHAAVVDCTADDSVARRYEPWLARGLHVVTPNKRAGAGPLARWRALRDTAKRSRSHFFYEATVGAGLPVITTLRDLIATGDRVLQVEGILSGTLSYVFSAFAGDASFSAVVREAKRLGYTEPDPRDDLSGMDVARKLVILAREMGVEIDVEDVVVESLVPEALRGHGTVEAFLDALAGWDDAMAKRRAVAERAGESLRYVGVVDHLGRASVSLRAYPATHPFARVSGGDNVFAFRTQRYHAQPLVVQGPGAGPEVTAGGVFADVLRLAAYVGGD